MRLKINEAKGRLADQGKRVSLNDIAEATGINTTTLDNISTGRIKEIRLDYIDALCAYFGVTAGELIQAEPVTLPLALNIRPDRHGAKVGQRTKGKSDPADPEPDLPPTAGIQPQPIDAVSNIMQTGPYPPGLAPLTAANLRKPLTDLIDPGAMAVDTIRMEQLEARRRALLEQANQPKRK